LLIVPFGDPFLLSQVTKTIYLEIFKMKLKSIIPTVSLLLLERQAHMALASNATNPDNSPMLYFDNDVYTSWYQGASPKYPNSVFMNTSINGGVGLFWSINMTNEMIQLAVVCPIGSGWCGFGIAEAGGMKGSDMIIYEAEADELYDAYVLDDISAGPVRDECQNWKLLNSIASSQVTQTKSGGTDDDGVMIFEATRLLDTGDTFDKTFFNDSDSIVPATRVIAAWGNTATVSYHGQNRLRDAVRFFRNGEVDEDSIFKRSMEELSEGFIDLTADNYIIPTEETTYADFCWTYADLVKLGLLDSADLHSIGFEAIVDGDALEYVHHFVLHAGSDPFTNLTSPVSYEYCDNNFTAPDIAYVWAPGEEPLSLPLNIGGPLGVNGFQSFRLETHYNNPSAVANVTDSSGVRIYWTSKKRDMDLGILQLGDPSIALYGETVGNGLSKHTFVCPETCSNESITQPVTVIREYLHMHKTGERQTNELLRNGQVIHTAVVDYFDFEQQGNIPAQQKEFQIQPGDSFRTICYYKSKDEVWGLGSQDEMCMR
jgi:Copper type II ascorbate-dependent monooxygenase, N-terminal domain/DOMON domain/Copper type II ascorbate-dependent monooxygenase, C-terminal domain